MNTILTYSAIVQTFAALATAIIAGIALYKWRNQKHYDIYLDSLIKLHEFCRLTVKYAMDVKLAIRDNSGVGAAAALKSVVDDSGHSELKSRLITIQMLVKEIDGKEEKYKKLKGQYSKLGQNHNAIFIASFKLIQQLSTKNDNEAAVELANDLDKAADNAIKYAGDVMASYA